MTERTPQSLPPDWNLAAINDALPGTVEPCPDAVLGNGLRLQVGPLPGTEVELFPSAGVVRIATPDVHIALVRQDPPTVAISGIVFTRNSETGISRLTIFRDGAIALALTPGLDLQIPVSAPERPADDGESLPQPISRVSSSQPLADNPVPADDPSRDKSVGADDEQEEKQRVHLQGRLGSAVRFRTTVNDKLIAQFPLAVHNDDKSTTWHTVVAFGDKATQIQAAELKKGEPIGVIGYEHERTYTKKDGTVKSEIQIYAAVVSRR